MLDGQNPAMIGFSSWKNLYMNPNWLHPSFITGIK